MRKLVINYTLGKDISKEEELETVAEVGWDGVFTGWGGKGSIVELAKNIEKNGLYYQSVHAPFGGAAKLWDEGPAGDDEVARLSDCLRDSAEVGVDLVIMHAIIGFDKFTPTELGVIRFDRLFDLAEKLNVRIALENTEGECYLETLLNASKGRGNVGFCIDTGHEMCYNYSKDLIGKYHDRVIATHLNDNMKITGDKITFHDDAHMLPFDGLADWQGIADRLKKAGYEGPLTFELTRIPKPEKHTHDIYQDLSDRQFIELAYEKAVKFRNMF
ncbi:MAG: sugar phosphate isomerase/epimerase [Clostridia bacterium]|nr:sugar phosphate isomerase/epimerase [Clostridia bacterium]